MKNKHYYKIPENMGNNSSEPISIGATCIAEIDDQFFLLVEIEVEVPGDDIEQVVIFNITEDQAEDLMEAGVEECTIVDHITKPSPGTKIDLLCVFVVGNFAFLVFDVENSTDEFLLVRVPLCLVVGDLE